LTKRKGADRARRFARPGVGGIQAGRSRELFDRLVVEALREIPEPFQSRLQNVAIVAEEEPSPKLLESLGMGPDRTLLGLYDGIPLPERGDWYNLVPPDRIVLFRGPILALCGTPEEVRREVRRTVLHEVAHFYGIGDEELERLGLD